MGKVSTKELLDLYFKSVAGTPAEKCRVSIDKPELYDYEVLIKKDLIDMEVDDLFGLILELSNKRKGKEIKYMTSHSSYAQMATLLRSIFNYYIDNIQPIRNPLNDKRMKGASATKRLAKGREPFCKAMVEDIIARLHNDLDGDKADYIELIILLFYNGFPRAKDIVELKENMINHDNKTVVLQNCTIHLSERCYDLLLMFNKKDVIGGWRGQYYLVSWHNSYFKYIVRESQKDIINDRPQSAMCDIINRYIARYVNDKFDMKISYHTLYLLGFYEHLVDKFGVEKTNEILNSYRDANDVVLLMDSAKEYGLIIDNVSYLKRLLRPFVFNEFDD